LKPSNVLLDPSGKPLLLDFNLSESEREATVFVGGTLRYMAPEQICAFLAKRKDGMDERVDFYALGVMVYELLGGVHPCATLLEGPYRDSQAEALLVDVKVGFRPFREICPELERPVAAILDRCVALGASARPSNAAELAAALKRQFTPVRRLRRWCAAHRRWLLATLGLVLVAVAVLAYAWAATPPYSQREYERGRIAYHAGDFDTAERHFDQALRAEPKNARFRKARGCARLQQSKYHPPDPTTFENIKEDLTFTERGAADPHTLAVHAYIDLRRQRTDDAIRKYDQILQGGYRSIMVLNNRAYVYFCRGQLREAQTDLDEAVKIDPHPPQAVHYNRALIGMRMRCQGKMQNIPPQVLEDMEQAVQLEPKTSALYRDAAILYAQAAGDYSRHSHFERALSYLYQAITSGEAPEKFHPFPALRDALKRPEFVALLGSQRPQGSSQPDLRLIDPVDLPD
jgi:tetratricopeptide (TPR) repeat protein